MINYVAQLKCKVEKIIRQVENGEEDILKRSLNATQLLGGTFNELKEYILNYTFKDDDEEILFFKDLKPNLCKHLIFYKKVYNIEMNRPLSGISEQIHYLKHELDCIQKYTQKRLDFYRYYRQGATHFDNIYFIRQKDDLELYPEQYLETFSCERDQRFSTNADFKVTRILANDMLQIYLMGELELLEKRYSPTGIFKKVKLTWALSKADLIELIYALDAVKAFGKVPMARVSSYLQDVFNVDLGNNISRTFSEMKTRISPTQFVTSLYEAIIKRMKILNKAKSN